MSVQYKQINTYHLNVKLFWQIYSASLDDHWQGEVIKKGEIEVFPDQVIPATDHRA